MIKKYNKSSFRNLLESFSEEKDLKKSEDIKLRKMFSLTESLNASKQLSLRNIIKEYLKYDKSDEIETKVIKLFIETYKSELENNDIPERQKIENVAKHTLRCMFNGKDYYIDTSSKKPMMYDQGTYFKNWNPSYYMNDNDEKEFVNEEIINDYTNDLLKDCNNINDWLKEDKLIKDVKSITYTTNPSGPSYNINGQIKYNFNANIILEDYDTSTVSDEEYRIVKSAWNLIKESVFGKETYMSKVYASILKYKYDNPMKTTPQILMFNGYQGTGKSEVCSDIPQLLFGNQFVNTQATDYVMGFTNFNDTFENKIWSNVNEIEGDVKDRKSAYNNIKSISGEKTILINGKNEKAIVCSQYSFYTFASNADSPIKIDVDDRRLYFVPRTDKNLSSYFRNNYDNIWKKAMKLPNARNAWWKVIEEECIDNFNIFSCNMEDERVVFTKLGYQLTSYLVEKPHVIKPLIKAIINKDKFIDLTNCQDYKGFNAEEEDVEYCCRQLSGYDMLFTLKRNGKKVDIIWTKNNSVNNTTPVPHKSDTKKDEDGTDDLDAWLSEDIKEENTEDNSPGSKPSNIDNIGVESNGKTIREVQTYEDRYCKYPTNGKDDEYESLNPLKYRKNRSNENVATYQYFMFESDDMPVGDQVEFWKNTYTKTWKTVFSGNKSVHAMIKIDDSYKVSDKQTYKIIHEILRDNFKKRFNIIFDFQTDNPAQLFRRSGHKRKDTGKTQQLINMYKEEFKINDNFKQLILKKKKEQDDLINSFKTSEYKYTGTLPRRFQDVIDGNISKGERWFEIRAYVYFCKMNEIMPEFDSLYSQFPDMKKEIKYFQKDF
jgi:hypothetical protein